ncbi:MAG: ABC transporter permease subunit [Sedimentisphaerales bacterium]|nr:ABC transporter permease subunit [Sedimentisphaerales bacterium]
MKGFSAVCKRELKSYFSTPLAYVFLCIFLAVVTGWTWTKGRFFEMRTVDLRIFFSTIPIIIAIFAPATAMRLWSEERRNGSIELLMTLPISTSAAVLGKFIAAWLFLGISLAATFPMLLTVAYLGSPDWGPIITGYLGSFLLAGACLAVGNFFSVLTKNQVICLVLSVVACAIMMILDLPSIQDFLTAISSPLARLMESMSFLTHFESMQRGVLQVRDVLFFLLVIAGWVFAGGIMLEERKAA